MLTDEAILAAARGTGITGWPTLVAFTFPSRRRVPAAGYTYRVSGKETLLVIGCNLDVSLEAAQLARDEAKRAGDRHVRQKWRWKPVHAAEVIESLKRDLLSGTGRYRITAINEPLLMAALKRVEKRGVFEGEPHPARLRDLHPARHAGGVLGLHRHAEQCRRSDGGMVWHRV